MKINLSFSLLFLAIPITFAFFNQHFTHVNYESNFTCELAKKENFTWCLYHRYFEWDLRYNDLLKIVYITCTNKTTITHKTKVTFDGKDGYFDVLQYYESLVETIHNCTSNGKTFRTFIHLPDISFAEKEVNQTYHRELANVGNRRSVPIIMWDIPKAGKLKFLGDWMNSRTIWKQPDGWYLSAEMMEMIEHGYVFPEHMTTLSEAIFGRPIP